MHHKAEDMHHKAEDMHHKAEEMHHKAEEMHHKAEEMHHKAEDTHHIQVEGDETWVGLMKLAEGARKKKRLDLEPVILRLCQERFVTKDQLVQLLGRAEVSLRNHYLARLVREGKLELLHPGKPKSPAQAYRTRGTTP
jgi:hypothetical protein